MYEVVSRNYVLNFSLFYSSIGFNNLSGVIIGRGVGLTIKEFLNMKRCIKK
jgi:hypothetical protein